MEAFNSNKDNENHRNKLDNFLSLTQFDVDLQQQAQFVIQQEIEPWEDFDNYLPPVTFSNQMPSPPDMNSPNNQVKMEITSPSDFPPPFGSPDSMINQQHSPLFSDQPFFTTSNNTTPLETPLESPKNSALLNFQLSYPTNEIAQDKNLLTVDSIKAAEKPPQQKKSAHNAIERRYRNNINDRIAELKNAVPALLYAKVKDNTNRPGQKRQQQEDEDEEDGEEYIDGVAVATKLNKATILRKATEYIEHLKQQSNTMKQENATLQHLLSQLPGGTDILNRYHMQKVQREQEMQRQKAQERLLQKQQLQQQRKANRKRSRHTSPESSNSDQFFMPVMHQQPQSVTNRVFMAVFMAITFFSSSPLSAGPSTKDQFESHNHVSRTADDLLYQNSTSTSFINTFFSLSDTWSSIRTAIFVICLFQLLFPVLRSWVSYGVKVRRVQKKMRTMTESKSCLNGNISSHVTSLTPGDQKCMKIYNILVKSLENDQVSRKKKSMIRPQQSGFGFYVALIKEIARFVSRHWLGYEILYDEQDLLTPQEQWVEVCKWIKLNEVECLGGNPEVTRPSMLYSCFHMLNMIEQLEDDENEYVEQSRSRVYATTALQMALVIPHHGISEKLSRYFLRLAYYESGLDEDPLMRALIYDCHEDDGEGRMEAMLTSRAWYETLEVMNQQIEHFGQQPDQERATGGLSLSLTAPVLIPVGILSSLHLLDNLQTLFGRLIISVTAKPLTAAMIKEEELASDFSETSAFSQMMDMTAPENDGTFGDYHSLAHWLATVGAIVDALWKTNVKTAHRLLKPLSQVPRSLVSRGAEDNVYHKNRMNQLDEWTKTAMIHVLVGATLLKDTKDAKKGLEELWKAEKIKQHVKKLHHHNKKVLATDLESSVLALAEFVTAITGLEAWIAAWRLAPMMTKPEDRSAWESTMTEQIRNASLHVRRMIRRHSLDGLRTNQAIVERLSRLCAFVSSQIDDVDSACECDDDDHLTYRRSEKALEILRGLS